MLIEMLRPSLPQDLRQILESQIQAQLASTQLVVPSNVLKRVLRVMALVTKEISAMKMLTGVKAMQTVNL